MKRMASREIGSTIHSFYAKLSVHTFKPNSSPAKKDDISRS
jgi:hypothetical protein